MKQKKESVRLRTVTLKLSGQRRTKKNEWKSKEILHDLWDLIKRTNMQIIGVSEREDIEKRADSYLQKYGWEHPTSGESWTSKFMMLIGHLTKSTYRNSLQDILHIINRSKIKEKIFFFQRENLTRNMKMRACNLQGNPIILSADFSAEISQARRLWNDILKVLKEKHADQEYFIQQSSPSEVRWDEHFPRQTKALEIHHHLACLSRNAERCPSRWNER